MYTLAQLGIKIILQLESSPVVMYTSSLLSGSPQPVVYDLMRAVRRNGSFCLRRVLAFRAVSQYLSRSRFTVPCISKVSVSRSGVLRTKWKFGVHRTQWKFHQ